jgi:hypothetical protein
MIFHLAIVVDLRGDDEKVLSQQGYCVPQMHNE